MADENRPTRQASDPTDLADPKTETRETHETRETRVSDTDPAAIPPAAEDDTVYRYRVRRVPNIWAFLVTGALVGAIVGFVLDFLGPDGCATTSSGSCTAPYSPGVSLAYFLVLGALAGIAVAATVVVAVDKYLSTR